MQTEESDYPDSTNSLTEVGAKTIEIYQKQMELADRVWAYFSLYSAMMVILTIALVVLRDMESVRSARFTWAIPIIAYFAFAFGNFRALKLTLNELHVLRGVAISQSGLDLQGATPPTALRFHLVMTYAVCAFYIYVVSRMLS